MLPLHLRPIPHARNETRRRCEMKPSQTGDQIGCSMYIHSPPIKPIDFPQLEHNLKQAALPDTSTQGLRSELGLHAASIKL